MVISTTFIPTSLIHYIFKRWENIIYIHIHIYVYTHTPLITVPTYYLLPTLPIGR
jgi:hypothetical protein